MLTSPGLSRTRKSLEIHIDVRGFSGLGQRINEKISLAGSLRRLCSVKAVLAEGLGELQVKSNCFPILVTILLALSPICMAQGNPELENANAAVLHAFETHNIVMIGEQHGNKQEYEWLGSLIGTPEFADRVDDIVMEFGNSLYQKSVDRYVSGEDVPFEQVQKAWRNTAGSVGPPSPMVAWVYQPARETNLRRRGKRQMRVLCGDPYIDWDRSRIERTSPHF
jgi:hypothetical protein